MCGTRTATLGTAEDVQVLDAGAAASLEAHCTINMKVLGCSVGPSGWSACWGCLRVHSPVKSLLIYMAVWDERTLAKAGVQLKTSGILGGGLSEWFQ